MKVNHSIVHLYQHSVRRKLLLLACIAFLLIFSSAFAALKGSGEHTVS